MLVSVEVGGDASLASSRRPFYTSQDKDQHAKVPSVPFGIGRDGGLDGGPEVQVSSCMFVECGRSQMNFICRSLGQVFW